MTVWLSSTHNHITVLMTHVMEQCFNVSIQYISLKIPESDALSFHVCKDNGVSRVWSHRILCHKNFSTNSCRFKISYAAVIDDVLPSDFRMLNNAISTSLFQHPAMSYNEISPATSDKESCDND